MVHTAASGDWPYPAATLRAAVDRSDCIFVSHSLAVAYSYSACFAGVGHRWLGPPPLRSVVAARSSAGCFGAFALAEAVDAVGPVAEGLVVAVAAFAVAGAAAPSAFVQAVLASAEPDMPGDSRTFAVEVGRSAVVAAAVVAVVAAAVA